MPALEPADLLAEADRKRSWRLFLEEYAAVVYRAAERIAHDPDDARDAAVEVLRAIAADWPELLRRFRPPAEGRGARFSTWLAVVARRHAIDALRKRYGRDRSRKPPEPMPLEGDDAAVVARATGSDPGAEVAQRDARAQLAKILAELSGAERGLLRVYFLEGTRAEDLRRMLGGRTTSQVYNRVSTLIGKLRSELARAGLGVDDFRALAQFEWAEALAAPGERP